MLFQSIVAALNILDKQEQIVLKGKDTRFEKFKAFRSTVKAELSKLGKLVYDHDTLFLETFDPRIKNEAEEFLKSLESCPFPDPQLVYRAKQYLNHLKYSRTLFNNRTNVGESLVRFCQDSITLVQEPPNFLKNYIANIPNDLDGCKRVLSRNYYDISILNLAHNKTGTFSECAEYGKNKQKIEMDAYQDVIDTFIVAVSEARQ